MTITANFQIDFNGTTLGGGTNGTEIISMDFLASPNIRSSDSNRPQADGQFAGQDFYVGRSLQASFEVWGSTDEELQANIQTVMVATQISRTEKVLMFRLPGWPDDLRSVARVRRRNGPVMDITAAAGHVAKFNIEWYATDPRLYSYTELSDVVTGLGTNPGMTFDMTFDLDFGGIGTSDSIIVENVGSIETYPTVVFTGPITDIGLENVTQNLNMEFTLSDLAEGDTLTLDFYNRTILLNGSINRHYWLDDSTQWWTLDPGDNTIRSSGTSAGTPTMTIYWRSAWA